MPVRRLRFGWTFAESERASGACRTHAWSPVVAMVDGMNVRDVITCRRDTWPRLWETVILPSMSDTQTHTRQTHTTINRDDDNVDNEKRGRATTTIIIIIIVVVATKRETKRRNSCNTAERCSTGWLAGRIVHHRCDNTNDSTCSFTESVVGQKRAWPVESSKECIPKHCQHTRIHKHKQSTEPCS